MALRRGIVRASSISALILVNAAHIGSPDAWYSGNAGHYPVQVQVGAPNVVPGIAKISVVVKGDGVREVTAGVNKFDATAAAPPPDVAVRDQRNQELYTTELWVMSAGSNAVTVTVKGDKGSGTAVIPVVVVATRVLQMDKPMGFALASVGLFLFVGVITLVASAVRESVLDPGVEADAGRRKLGRIAAAVATVLVSALLFGGWSWWNSEETAYKRGLFKPMRATAATQTSASGLSIQMSIAESAWIKRRDSAWLAKAARSTSYTPLIPDHGKLMHMFVIGGPDNSAFAHLHPETADSVTFSAALPALPAGSYRVFGDIVHESGFSQTLSATLKIPALDQASRVTDGDDSWLVQAATTGTTSIRLQDGSLLKWETNRTERTVGVEAGLHFSVKDSAGKGVELEPYMGMAGHAVVMKEDGSVFVHLHPSGTISMASQMALQMREAGDSVAGTLSKRMADAHMGDTISGSVTGESISFPYAFPQAGNYLVWVQVKRGGKIQTGVLRVAVKS